MLLQKYAGNTMASLVKLELENAQARQKKMLRCERSDIITAIVLNKVEHEIQKLTRKYDKERKSDIERVSA